MAVWRGLEGGSMAMTVMMIVDSLMSILRSDRSFDYLVSLHA
jgi:hypothetical protein